MKENRRWDTSWLDELSITIEVSRESMLRFNQAMDDLLLSMAILTWKRRAAALIFALSILIVLLGRRYG